MRVSCRWGEFIEIPSLVRLRINRVPYMMHEQDRLEGHGAFEWLKKRLIRVMSSVSVAVCFLL